jgi:methylated-DNA-[protein]-cysteine S-methyltransferase
LKREAFLHARCSGGLLGLNYFQFPVSFGTILICWNSQDQLTRIEWSENRLAFYQRVKLPAALAELVDQIRGYFYHGEPLGPIVWELLDKNDWSLFQTKVYEVISTIPHGETRTYGWVARKLGQASASRAVGQALRKNPLPILIPCHRILALHSIGGFMGTVDPNQPEIMLKQKLMKMEEQYRSPVFSFLASSAQCVRLG